MKNLTLILLFLTLCFEGMTKSFPKIDGDEVCLLKALLIEGKTNINKFYLTYHKPSFVDSSLNKLIHLKIANRGVFEFKIPTNKIEGRNDKILKEFRKLLKSKEYENIVVEIKQTEFLSVLNNDSSDFLNVNLTLAGISRNIKTSYTITKLTDVKLCLKGKTEVHLSDFLIIPPKKFLGFVRVKDVIFITFDILINETR